MCLLLILLLFPDPTAHNDLFKLRSLCRNCVADSEGNSNQDIWILAFTEQLEALLAGSHLSLRDKTDDIEVYLISLEDLCLVYNLQTTNVTKVVSLNAQRKNLISGQI